MITHTLPLAEFYPRRPLILAHRGASYDAPENTLSAFRIAQQMGADGVELDTHLSREDVPVVIHNFTVDETTDGTGRVRDLTVSDLKRLDAGSHYDYTYRHERIPTLDEVFDLLAPTMRLNVELKSVGVRATALEATVLAVIRRHNAQNRVVISSFNPFALRRMYRLAPNLPLGYLYSADVPAYFRLFMIGVPYQARHPHHLMIDADYVAWAHRNHYRINTWTVDDPSRATALKALGVDALITNRPDVLLSTLGRSNKSEPQKTG